MDKFLIRGPLKTTMAAKRKFPAPREANGDAAEESSGSDVKKPKQAVAQHEKPHWAGTSWRQIRAVGLNCDYKILFSKPEADRMYQDLENEVEYFEGEMTKLRIFGKWHNVPRRQVTYGDAGLTYTYSGATFSPKPWIPVLSQIRDRVQLATGHTFNFVLINRYKDGQDHIGEHRDDERELVPRSSIASVTFGACRDFVFRHSASRGKNPSSRVKPITLQLEHGSLLLMNFPTNRYWHHSLPARKKVLAPRINLTFRDVMAS